MFDMSLESEKRTHLFSRYAGKKIKPILLHSQNIYFIFYSLMSLIYIHFFSVHKNST